MLDQMHLPRPGVNSRMAVSVSNITILTAFVAAELYKILISQFLQIETKSSVRGFTASTGFSFDLL